MTIFYDAYHAARRKSRIVKVTAGAVTAVIVGAVVLVTPPGGGGAQTANIWIDQNGGTCLDDGGHVYSDATACSFDAANDTCEGGDNVAIKGGTYGNVTITKAGANSGRSSRCTMTVASSETATMTQLNLGEQTGGDTGPDWLTIQGRETAFGGCRDLAEGACSLRMVTVDSDNNNQVTISNFEQNGGTSVTQCFHAEGAANFIASRGKIHDCRASGTTGAMTYISGGPHTFEDVVFYNGLLLVGYTGTPHTECLYATSTNGLTLRRVQAYSCSAEIIFLTGGGSCPSSTLTVPNLTVENSIFQTPNGPNNNSFKFRTGGCPSPYPVNLLMRNNIFSIVVPPDSMTSATGTVVNNFFKSGGAFCGGSITCTTNDTSEPDASFTSPVWTTAGDTVPATKGDFTITSGSGLRNAGTNSNCPTIDYAGNPRPRGGTCDIGPYEYQE